MSEYDWNRYYDAVRDLPPHRTLMDALGLMELTRTTPRAGLGIDLGCGTGRDTLELLRRGWNVLAVDREKDALDRLQSLCPPDQAPRLRLLQTPFESMTLEECDFVNASLSLPFVRPDRFETVWETIAAAIRPGGWFAGHFFGPRDDWASRTDVTTLGEDEVRALFRGFEIKSFTEKEEDGVTVHQVPKHWHRFSVVARRNP